MYISLPLKIINNMCNKKHHPFRSYHLRNLSLYHICNVWSLVHRGYKIPDFEFYTQHDPYWIGFHDMDFTHVLRDKPRLKDHPKKVFSSCIQLSLFEDYA